MNGLIREYTPLKSGYFRSSVTSVTVCQERTQVNFDERIQSIALRACICHKPLTHYRFLDGPFVSKLRKHGVDCKRRLPHSPRVNKSG